MGLPVFAMDSQCCQQNEVILELKLCNDPFLDYSRIGASVGRLLSVHFRR